MFGSIPRLEESIEGGVAQPSLMMFEESLRGYDALGKARTEKLEDREIDALDSICGFAKWRKRRQHAL